MELAGSWLEEDAMSLETIAGLEELQSARKLRRLNLWGLQVGVRVHAQPGSRLEIPLATRASGSASHF